MRKIVSRVFLILAGLGLAFVLVSGIVMTVQDWPCMSHPSTPFTDAVVLVLFVSTPLGFIGAVLIPPPAQSAPPDSV